VNNSSTPSAGGGPPSGGGPTRDASLTALSEILGWRVNKTDPDGIRHALSQAFTITRDENGTSDVAWVPRGLRVQVNRSGSATITGAQSSLLARATTMVEQVKQLLDGLHPLATSDDEDVESIHALIGPGLDDLLDQFGAEGGPVPQRVDHIFNLLVGYNPNEPLTRLTPENVSGQLQALGDNLGIDASRVNTIAEEVNLTNFHTVVAYIDTLRTMWHTERSSFDRNDDTAAFLGTQTVLIERALNCVARSLQEVEFAFDSVFVTADERATLFAKVDGIDVTFAEIFSWIEDIATRDGFDAIRWSGKDGLQFHLAPTLDRLADIVTALLNFIDADSDKGTGRTLPEAFSTNRVRTALDELQKHLANAAVRAGHVKRPAPGPRRPRLPIALPIAKRERILRRPRPPVPPLDPIVNG
jgi:hypothetical protein